MISFDFDLSAKREWNLLFKNQSFNQQDIYYCPEYYELYERNDEGKAKCFIYKAGKEVALYPFLINSVNILGYELDKVYFDIQGAYGYNGVISSCNESWFIKEFYESFDKYCADNRIIAEFTRFHPLLNNQEFSAQNLNVVFDRHTIFLDITQEYDVIWDEEFSSKNRNMIRKAEKSGVRTYISQDEKDFTSFIELYVETMQNVGASDYYFFNKNYFTNIQNGLKNNHYLISSKIDDVFVGGMILFIYGDYAHYHLSARKKEFGKYAINNHFLDYAIKFAKEKGCRTFHFGGGTSSDENDPLFKFKSNFSSMKGNFYFGTKVHNEHIYNLVVEQWKDRFPDSFNQNRNRLLGYREIKKATKR